MEHTRTITREFPTGDKAVLHVEARSGAVGVESVDDARVLVEAVVHVWSDLAVEADEAASLVARGMEQDAHRVMVRAPSLAQTEGWSLWGGKRGSRVDYTIRVPVQTAVRVLSRSGRVQIARVDGRVHVESQSGRVSIDRICGDVTVVVRSGGVSIEHVQGNVTAEARSGRLEIGHVSGATTASARSGALGVREVGGDVEITANTGSITIENAGARVKAEAHTGAIRFRGKVAADIEMRARTGMIHMAVDPSTPFFVDAESDLGAVRSELPPRSGGASNGTGPRVRLRTHTGAIRLSRV